ncbi:MAG: hypothetical protein DMG22_10725 [Acidobacteria bacterium]|nr:MAG: hypothetical protein DMG22_10725 [Acidobacteriota bacterium]
MRDEAAPDESRPSPASDPYKTCAASVEHANLVAMDNMTPPELTFESTSPLTVQLKWYIARRTSLAMCFWNQPVEPDTQDY